MKDSEAREVVGNALGNFIHGRPSWAFKQMLTFYQGNAPKDVVEAMLHRLERNDRCYTAIATRHRQPGHTCDELCAAMRPEPVAGR